MMVMRTTITVNMTILYVNLVADYVHQVPNKCGRIQVLI